MSGEFKNPEELREAISQVAALLGGLAEHAATIAHCRRVMFDAYLAEGFTAEQALDLCKVMTLS